MTSGTGTTAFYPSVSCAHFSFFNVIPDKPSYLLNPLVRLSDQRISLKIIRDNTQELQARQANFNKGLITPFGKRQLGYLHHISRFPKKKVMLRGLKEAGKEQERQAGIKWLMRQINRLQCKKGGMTSIEEKAELTALLGQLNPAHLSRQEAIKTAFFASFGQIAKSLNAELPSKQ